MKKYIIPALAIVALMASCNKEVTQVEEAKNNVEIRAIINNDEVKSNYDIDGSTAAFYWTGTEVFGRLNYDNGVGTDTYTSTTSAANKETTLTFSGHQDGTSSNYALYPLWDGTNTNGLDCRLNGKELILYLAETIAYNPDAPLKDIVPMIGTLTNGEFEFVPATGVIAVTVKNLPSTATKITLSSGGYNALSGTYRVTSNFSDLNVALSGVTLGLTTDMAFYSGNYSGKKTLTFSGLDRGTYTFYFPVSVATSKEGKYVNLTISVYAGDLLLQTVTNPNQITVGKGQIVRFPEMDLAKATKVAVTGTSQQFYAYLNAMGPEVTSVKVSVASTAESAITAARNSSKVISTSGIDNKVEVSDELTASGQYYLGYIVNAGDSEILTGSIPVYYLSSADASSRVGTYKHARSQSMSHAALVTNGDDSITIEVSDNPTKGNLMITQAFGFCNEVLNSTHKTLATYDFTKFTNGNPIYGLYNPASGEPQLVFSNTNQQVFYYDASGTPHYISEYGATRLRFAVDSNANFPSEPAYDLVCYGGYIMNCYNTTSNYDFWFQKFCANKEVIAP